MGFLAIPSVSTLRKHQPDVAKAARWLVAKLERIGMEHVQLFETPGHPIVYADWMHAKNAPTVIVYGHYDVQPADPEGLWVSPPFQPQVRDGRVFARGSSDDKGPLLLHLQAIETLLQADQALPVNIKVLFEGEEEIGSPNLIHFARENAELVAADLLVASDTSMIEHNVPTICCGLRGIATLEVHVEGANSDLHSGVYGGAAPNALHILVEMLARLRDGQGRVLVPGFYDDVVELSADERDKLRQLPFDETALRRQLGVEALHGEQGYTAFERMTIRPTLELNGVWGGYQGEGSKTVIPAAAHAKISCRLVPNQDAATVAERVASFLKEQCPAGARVQVVMGDSAPPWACATDHPFLLAAARALRDTFAQEVCWARLGGSIPVVATLCAVLQAPAALLAFAPPDNNAHAPNESLTLDTYELGVLAMCRVWHEIKREYTPSCAG